MGEFVVSFFESSGASWQETGKRVAGRLVPFPVPFQVPEAIPEEVQAQMNTVFQVKCGNMGMTPQLLLVSFLNSWWSHGSVHIFV